VKIYSSIACFRNVRLVGAGESLLVTNPSVKVPRVDPRALTGKQTAIPHPGAVHLFRHTSPAAFLPRVICSSLSRRREPHSPRFKHKNSLAQKSGSVFPILNGQLEAAFPMEPSISMLNCYDVLLVASPRKTRELWPSSCCAPQTMISVHVKSYA